MDGLLISAASGMRARMESLDMLANNLANASTGGYKGDREFYGLYVAAEAEQAASDGVSPEADVQPVIEKRWTDYTQGSMRLTGNTLDIGIEGSGFLAVNGPTGVLYTRSGNLKLNAAGVLTTSDGFALKTVAGDVIQSSSKSPLKIEEDGTVLQDAQAIGQLSLVDFADPGSLSKRGMSYFVNPDPQVNPSASTAVIHQGHLEDSNVASAGSAVRLIDVMRQFETLQKAITIGSDMNKSAVEEVARVSQ